MGEIDACLAGLLLGTGGYDDDVGILEHVRVIGTVKLGHRGKHQAMVKVQDFGFDLLFRNVVEANVLANPSDHARIGDGCPHTSRADDSDFPCLLCHCVLTHFGV